MTPETKRIKAIEKTKETTSRAGRGLTAKLAEADRAETKAVRCGCSIHVHAEYHGERVRHGCGLEHAGPCNIACAD